MNELRETCFACGEAANEDVVENYRLDLPDGDTIEVQDLHFQRCRDCGEETIPPESARRVEQAIEKEQETLSAEEVRRFLEQFQIDQTAAAKALGLGAKTFHRWTRGTQRVSRSMGYFLRALMAHPRVFNWIRERQWEESEQERISIPAGRDCSLTAKDADRFPALERSSRTPRSRARVTGPANPTILFQRVLVQ